MRLLKRFASRVVLAFDADAAGQGAAERFYEWEQKYQVEVSVAAFPQGKDPGELAQTRSGGAGARRSTARCRSSGSACSGCCTAGRRARPRSGPGWPSRRWRWSTSIPTQRPQAVRRPGGGHVGLPVADLVAVGRARVDAPVDPASPTRRQRAPRRTPSSSRSRCSCSAGTTIAPWLVEALFADESNRRAFLAVAEADGDLDAALELADPEAREVLERAAVADVDADRRGRGAQPDRRGRAPRAGDVGRRDRSRRRSVDDREAAARSSKQLDDRRTRATRRRSWLLGWLQRRSDERSVTECRAV